MNRSVSPSLRSTLTQTAQAFALALLALASQVSLHAQQYPEAVTDTIPQPSITVPLGTGGEVTVGAGFGRSVALSSRWLAVATSNAVLIYDRTSETPLAPAFALLDPLEPGTSTFGNTIATSGDLLAVSSFYPALGGRVYVYNLASEDPTVPVHTLAGSTGINDGFGETIALDGRYLAVGAPNASPYSRYVNGGYVTVPRGAIYAFDLEGSPAAVLLMKVDDATQNYGRAIAISGSRLIAGDPYALGGAGSIKQNYGRASVYDLSNPTPSTATIRFLAPALGPDNGESFGKTVGIYGEVGFFTNFSYDPLSIPKLYVAQPGVAGYRSLTLDSPGTIISTSNSSVLVQTAAGLNLYEVSAIGALVHKWPVDVPLPSKYSMKSCAIHQASAAVAITSASAAGIVYLIGDDSASEPPVLHTPTGTITAESQFTLSVTLPESALVYPATAYTPALAAVKIWLRGTQDYGFQFYASDHTPYPQSVDRSKAGTYTLSVGIKSSVAQSYQPLQPPVSQTQSVPPGTYTVSVEYQDARGNPLAISNIATVIIPNTGPIITPPADITAEATSSNGAYVNLPPITAVDPQGVKSTRTIPATPGQFPLGVTPVTIIAEDYEGNINHASFNVEVKDTTAPQFGYTPLHEIFTSSSSAPLPDLTSLAQAATLEATSVAEIAQLTAPNTYLGLGVHHIPFRLKDGFQNTRAAHVTVRVLQDLNAEPTDPPPGQGSGVLAGDSIPVTTDVSAQSGRSAPFAGESGGLPNNAKLYRFDAPAVGDDSVVARVLIKANGRLIPAIYRQHGEVEETLAFQGGYANGFSYNVRPPVYLTLGDPVLTGTGEVAYVGTGRGELVNGRNDTAVWLTQAGAPTPILREGEQVWDLPANHTLKSVLGLCGTRNGLLLRIKLNAYPGFVRANVDDDALLLLEHPENLPRLLFRTGQDLAGSTVKSYSALQPALGSHGQGRSGSGDLFVVKALLANGQTVLARLRLNAEPEVILSTGEATTGLSLSAQWINFGLPIAAANGAVAVEATLNLQRGAISGLNDTVLLYRAPNGSFQPVAEEGVFAPIPTPANSTRPQYGPFLPPVINSTGHIAFVTQLRGGGVTGTNSQAIFYGLPSAPALLARQGSAAVDRDGEPLTGVTWKTFSTLALPDGEVSYPIFVATLAGRAPAVTVRNNLGLYALDGAGKLRQLLRTGFSISSEPGAKTLAKFRVLESSTGANGSTRSYNGQGTIAVQATFTDGTEGLVKIALP